MRFLVLIAGAGMLLYVSDLVSAAPNIERFCAKKKDPLGCRCALNNGGYIMNKKWYGTRGSLNPKNSKVNDAFIRCLYDAGRR